MSHSRIAHRIAASVTAFLIAAMALVVTDATAAHAVTQSTSNTLATLTVSAHADNVGGRFLLDGRVTPNTAAGDCGTDTPMMSWKVGTTSGGFTTSVELTNRFARSYMSNPTTGTTVDILVTVRGGCAGPDGFNPDLQLTISVDVADLVTYMNDAITGTAYLGDTQATTADAYSPASGVVVDLLDISQGLAGAPVASFVTGANGQFWLPAPVGTQEEADRRYTLRYSYPGGEIVYYGGGPVSAFVSSPADWDAAADAAGPRSWYSTTGYDGIFAASTEPSVTDTSRQCSAINSQRIDDFTSGAVAWEAICETDPTFFNATLEGSGLTAAFARFGSVWFEQASGAYTVTADRFTTSNTGGVLTTTLHDDDIYLINYDVTVDVTITRVFEGSDTQWLIEVRDDVTGNIVDVPFSFNGEQQNDVRTSWTRSTVDTDAWVSDGRASRTVDVKEAIVAHHAIAGLSYDRYAGLDSFQLDVRGGVLSYYLAVLDYTGCVVGSARAAALTIAESLPTTFGTARTAIAGDDCEETWQAPTVDAMTVGVPFEQSFTVDSSHLNWAWGGGAVLIEFLPDGLSYEAIDELQPGVAPGFRIYGTPTTVAPFSIRVMAMDAVFRQDEIRLVGEVQAQSTVPPGGGDPDDTAPAQLPLTGPDATLGLGTASVLTLAGLVMLAWRARRRFS